MDAFLFCLTNLVKMNLMTIERAAELPKTGFAMPCRAGKPIGVFDESEETKMTDQSKIQIICHGECLDTETYGAQAYAIEAWTIRLNDELITLWQDWQREEKEPITATEDVLDAMAGAFMDEILLQLGLEAMSGRTIIEQVVNEIFTVVRIKNSPSEKYYA